MPPVMLSALMMTFLPPEEEADFAEPPEETAGFAVPARVASVWSAAGLAAAALTIDSRLRYKPQIPPASRMMIVSRISKNFFMTVLSAEAKQIQNKFPKAEAGDWRGQLWGCEYIMKYIFLF